MLLYPHFLNQTYIQVSLNRLIHDIYCFTYILKLLVAECTQLDLALKI